MKDKLTLPASVNPSHNPRRNKLNTYVTSNSLACSINDESKSQRKKWTWDPQHRLLYQERLIKHKLPRRRETIDRGGWQVRVRSSRKEVEEERWMMCLIVCFEASVDPCILSR